jgi:hypothetical protein
MMLAMKIGLFGWLALVCACVPADVIPSGAGHPANPAAPIGCKADVPTASETPHGDGGMHGMDMSGMDMSGAHDNAAALAKAEQDALAKAQPVLDAYCAKCHSSNGKKPSKKAMMHFDMTSYPFGGHHAKVIGAAIREALGASGKDPSMPADDPGAVKGDELAAILAWTKAFDDAHPNSGVDDDDDDAGGKK